MEKGKSALVGRQQLHRRFGCGTHGQGGAAAITPVLTSQVKRALIIAAPCSTLVGLIKKSSIKEAHLLGVLRCKLTTDYSEFKKPKTNTDRLHASWDRTELQRT